MNFKPFAKQAISLLLYIPTSPPERPRSPAAPGAPEPREPWEPREPREPREPQTMNWNFAQTWTWDLESWSCLEPQSAFDALPWPSLPVSNSHLGNCTAGKLL